MKLISPTKILSPISLLHFDLSGTFTVMMWEESKKKIDWNLDRNPYFPQKSMYHFSKSESLNEKYCIDLMSSRKLGVSQANIQEETAKKRQKAEKD